MSTTIQKGAAVVSVAAVRWSLALLFLLNMTVSFVVAIQSGDRDDRIAMNTYNMCLATNRSANSTNTVIEALEAGANDTGVFTPAEKEKRIARYKAAVVPIIPCGQFALK